MTASRVAEVLAGLTADAGAPDEWPLALTEQCRDRTHTDGVCLALTGLTTDGELQSGGVVAATDPLAAQLEAVQFAVGAGPCLTALRESRPVSCPDLTDPGEQRWPAFAAEMGARGVRAVFAFPLEVGAIRLGVLELHRESAGLLSREEHGEARVFADVAIAVLLHLQDRSDREPDAAPPPAALVGGHSVVHQASGMVAAQLGSSLSVALARLRAHAWTAEVPLTTVGRQVVTRRLRFDDSLRGVFEPGPAPTTGDADRGATP